MKQNKLDIICAFLEILFIIFFIISLAYMFVFIDKRICEEKYNNSIHSFYGWCKIKYNWEYLSEELYIKAFDKNLNINLK